MQWLFSLLPDYYVMRLQGDRTLSCAMCLVVFLFIALKNIMTGLTMSRTTLFSERLGLFISRETYSRFFYKDYIWHISPEASDVLWRLSNRVHLTAMTTAILQFCGYSICCLFMTISLFSFEPHMTLVIGITFAVVSYATYKGVRLRIDHAGTSLNEISARENRAVSLATRGVREIIIYQKQPVFIENIVKAIRDEMPYKSFLAFAGSLPAWLLEVSGFGAILSVMVYFSSIGRPLPEIISSISMLFLSAWRLLPSVSRCMGLAVAIRGLRAMAMSCLELLESFTCERPGEMESTDPNFHFEHFLDCSGVCFRYPHAPEECLHDVTMRVEKGESVGLIGPSGAGKSTLAMLLAGLLTPASGDFLVDGQPLDGSSRAAYRRTIGFVPQTPLLFPGTIADNVALSKWGEEYAREKVEIACINAAMDFIHSDHRGIDFPIGEGGQGLSGGQAQRVSIARALFNDPEILILDEATSSLDQGNENIIASTIHQLKGRITTIIIAHRLTTVEQCDRLIWMDGGRIVADGLTQDVLPAYKDHMRSHSGTSGF